MLFFDIVMKYFVFEVSFIRNMQYDLERLLKKLEDDNKTYELNCNNPKKSTGIA